MARVSNTFSSTSESVPVGFTASVPATATAKGKPFYFSLTKLELIKQGVGTFTFTDIPPFAHPKQSTYDAQLSLSSNFNIGIPVRVSTGNWRFKLTFLVKFFMANTGAGDLEPFLPTSVIEFTGEFESPGFFPFSEGIFFCCVRFTIDELNIATTVQHSGTETFRQDFRLTVPNATTEFIIPGGDVRSFTTSAAGILSAEAVVTLKGSLEEIIKRTCVTQGEYGVNAPILDASGDSPAAPPARNRSLQLQVPLDLNKVNLLSAWQGDVQWFTQNGQIAGATGTEFSIDQLNSGDQVFAQVTFNEGPRQGETDETESVVVPNHPPSVESLEVFSNTEKPITTSTLTAQPQGWQDEDGDAENYIFRWFNQNGLITGAEGDMLDGSNFERGDAIIVLAIPFDGVIPGEGIQAALSIENAPPSFADLQLQIDPLPAREKSVIAVQPIGWQDPDGDAERYDFTWNNQDGPLKGTVAFPNQENVRFESTLPFEFTPPFSLQAGLRLTVPLAGIQTGMIRFISPSGKVIEQSIPETQNSDIEGNFTVNLDEVGDYTVEETFQFIIRSTNRLIPIEGGGQQMFTWIFTNTTLSEQAFNYMTQIRNLVMKVTGQIEANVEVPNPGSGIDVPFVVREAIPAGTPLTGEVEVQADFTKQSAITATGVVVTGETLSGENFGVGDEVFVVVTATDGRDAGNTIESERILILNTPPTLDSAQIETDSIPSTTQSTLTATAIGFSDDDGGAEQVFYQWFNQNGPIEGATSETLSGEFVSGDTVFVEATPSDGQESGPSLNSNSIIIVEPWDVNGDNVVNIFDLVVVGGEFGKTPPDNLAADINRDGTVNIFDLVLVGSHFGETFAAVNRTN